MLPRYSRPPVLYINDDSNHTVLINRKPQIMKTKIIVMRTTCSIIKTMRYMRATPILAEDYLRKQISEANRPQTDDKTNELID